MTAMGRIGAGLALAAMIAQAPVGALAQAPASARTPAAAPAADGGYVLGEGDVVEVSVLGRDDFRSRVRVQVDGSVQLPLIGRVVVAGRTALQVGEDVKRALRSGGYFSNPVVNVDIATYASRYITVLGEVGSPGLVPIDRGYRVSEILARVGGVKETGADNITLRRASGEEQQLAVVALATGGPNEDPIVSPGDKLYIPAAKTFYIYGQVTAPGTYRLDSEMTLRKALARGGGLTPSGSEKRVRVYRAGQEIKKSGLNDGVQPGDVIVVGERFF